MGRQSRLRRRRRTRGSKVLLTLTLLLLASGLLFSLAGAAAATGVVVTWLRDLPDYTSPTAYEVAEPTRVYSADGVLLAKFYLQNREMVPMSQMATSLVRGVVDVEDERFYQHIGVDPVGLVRAALSSASGDRQGASTITQQYVRNTVLLDERTKMTLARKVREAYIATELEKTLSKDQILENYLNTVYFGEGAYGAEAAAHAFFGKSSSQLTLPEGALLAGLVQSPKRLDPYVNPEAAIGRRKAVLSRMLYNRDITQADYDAAVVAPLALNHKDEPLQGIYYAPYYVSYVRALLQQRYSSGTVFNGGLTVYTTLDTRMQGIAEKVAHRDFNGRRDPSVALVAIDPRNGYVKAMVGGTNYAKSKFNLATQGYRQPGSSFKTFVLVAALAKGMSPSYSIDSHAPVSIPATPHTWVVGNDEGTGHGMVSLDSATWHSVNAVYARVAYYGVGIKSVVRTARAMGITTPLPNYASITLGSVGCTPLEMASAYGTLANEGRHFPPITITEVVDRKGNVIFEASPKGRQVISPKVAHAASNVLKGVISRGTATAAKIGRPAAGKTGTSQSNRDCWFVGYTPQLVTSVWVGYTPERTVVVRGSKGFGGTVAAPIWARFMRSALAGQPKKDFAWASSPRYSGSFHIPVSYETQHPPAPKVTRTHTWTAAKKSGTKKSRKKSKRKSGGGTGGGSSGGGSTPTTSTP